MRAVFGVAETGSVFLTEADFRINALGFLSQHLVVLLDTRDIVPNLHHAYRHRGFFDARYAVFMTGPSATADIEGVLIRGAQGHPEPHRDSPYAVEAVTPLSIDMRQERASPLS